MELITTAFVVSALVLSAVYRGLESRFGFIRWWGYALRSFVIILYTLFFLFPFGCVSYPVEIFA